MLYDIIVTRHGIPHQTWEVGGGQQDQAITAAQAVDACRTERIISGEHSVFDTYEASAFELAPDDAEQLVLIDAMRRMPALRELVMARVESALARLSAAPAA
jgi:hypothetical protein